MLSSQSLTLRHLRRQFSVISHEDENKIKAMKEEEKEEEKKEEKKEEDEEE